MGHQETRTGAGARQYRLDVFEQQNDRTKKAAHGLLDTLKKAATKPGDVKVAIIPFDTTVNIGTTYAIQPWFDIGSLDCGGWRSSGCTSTNWKDHWEGCVSDRTSPYDVQDTAPTITITNDAVSGLACGSWLKPCR